MFGGKVIFSKPALLHVAAVNPTDIFFNCFGRYSENEAVQLDSQSDWCDQLRNGVLSWHLDLCQ